MLAQKYKLRYLPIFYDDLDRCALYIANDLFFDYNDIKIS